MKNPNIRIKPNYFSLDIYATTIYFSKCAGCLGAFLCKLALIYSK